MDPYFCSVHKYLYNAYIGFLEIKIGDALVGSEMGAAAVENGVELPQKINHGSTF